MVVNSKGNPLISGKSPYFSNKAPSATGRSPSTQCQPGAESELRMRQVWCDRTHESHAHPAVIMVASYQLSGLQVEELFSSPGAGKGGTKGKGRGQSTTGPSSILDSNSKLGKQILFETTDVAEICHQIGVRLPKPGARTNV